MTKVIVAGAAGRMGCRLVALLKQAESLELTSAIEGPGHPALGKDAGEIAGCGTVRVQITDQLKDIVGRGEVIIDFSSPQATLEHLKLAVHHKLAMVIGTTGFSPDELEQIRTHAKSIACVLSPNMSVGVNLMFVVIEQMAKVLGGAYDIEVIEAHHRLKKDAPSGTALKLGEILAKTTNRDLGKVGVYARKGMIGERKKDEIGMQTVRAGDIVGDHTVLFGGMGERLELTHRAHSRDTFAAGALRAAQWISTQRPGLYDMADVLGIK